VTTTATNKQVNIDKYHQLRITIIDPNWRCHNWLLQCNTTFGALAESIANKAKNVTDKERMLFWYKGKLAQCEDTPRSLQMANGDVVMLNIVEAKETMPPPPPPKTTKK